MFLKPRGNPHHRPAIRTTEQAVIWLRHWHNGHLTPPGALTHHPWRHTSPRELASVAESLLKLRAAFDAGGRRAS